jgi:hypothetical protein
MLLFDAIQRIFVLGMRIVGGANVSINKMNSQKDEEQKASGNYFFLES